MRTLQQLRRNRFRHVAALLLLLLLGGCAGQSQMQTYHDGDVLPYRHLLPREEAGVNLLAQGSFETDLSGRSTAAPWRGAVFTPSTVVPVELDDSRAWEGKQSAKTVVPGEPGGPGGPGGPGNVSDKPVHLRERHYWVTPGETYTLSGYFQAKNIRALTLRISIFEDLPEHRHKAAYWAGRSKQYSQADFPDGQWVRIACSVTIPEGFHRLQPAVTFFGNSTVDGDGNDASEAGSVWMDGVQLERNSEATAFSVGGREKQLATLQTDYQLRSWEVGSVTFDWLIHGFAFDTHAHSMWASLEEPVLPKDIGLTFAEAVTLRGVRVDYLSYQQRPSPVGTHWQKLVDGKWVDIPYRYETNGIVIGSVVEYEFLQPVEVGTLRLLMTDKAGYEPDNWIGVRDVQFWFSGD